MKCLKSAVCLCLATRVTCNTDPQAPAPPWIQAWPHSEYLSKRRCSDQTLEKPPKAHLVLQTSAVTEPALTTPTITPASRGVPWMDTGAPTAVSTIKKGICPQHCCPSSLERFLLNRNFLGLLIQIPEASTVVPGPSHRRFPGCSARDRFHGSGVGLREAVCQGVPLQISMHSNTQDDSSRICWAMLLLEEPRSLCTSF